MTEQHKHHKEIKAWADGATIQYRDSPTKKWKFIKKPNWCEGAEYRVKPEREFQIGAWYPLKLHRVGLIMAQAYMVRGEWQFYPRSDTTNPSEHIIYSSEIQVIGKKINIEWEDEDDQ